MTISPIFLHLHIVKWSKLHLATLCVSGLDKDDPVERVVGREYLPVSSGSSEDIEVADILRTKGGFGG